ncbi:Aste57867_21039 [Aphanomyces stellatus]|uniref:Aste57867_21039 protein n=1 Tax=Aphanomyces stellatus TaxID=120398 RepID=A0A485LGF8_9STRA|nr:hypothetical protein As57867_020971 [Aphanomyces stellatus]VFT97714.1 Aste57867_21039 [Aphanomyces stellatus]
MELSCGDESTYSCKGAFVLTDRWGGMWDGATTGWLGWAATYCCMKLDVTASDGVDVVDKAIVSNGCGPGCLAGSAMPGTYFSYSNKCLCWSKNAALMRPAVGVWHWRRSNRFRNRPTPPFRPHRLAISTMTMESPIDELGQDDVKFIDALLPCRSAETGDILSLEDHPAVLVADDECHHVGGDNIVHVVDDVEAQQPAVEIRGSDARLVLQCHSVMRYLVLFAKNMDAFFAFEVEMLDDKKIYREFHITNARSLARVTGNACQMPLAFGRGGSGWRYICLDVQRMCLEAFGTQHVATVQVRIHATCRLLRAYFQEIEYSDAELPSYLALLE